MDRKPLVLQIYHDYKGPFRTISRQYAGAFADCDVVTVFLRGPELSELAESIHGEVKFLMMDRTELHGLKKEGAEAVKRALGSRRPDVIIAHRYKPLFIAMRINGETPVGAVIGVMHEFGFLKRLTRSIYSRFWAKNVYLIGVSDPVSDEIKQTQKHLSDRVFSVPHAIEAPTLLDPVTARHDLGIPLGNFCFGVIARLVRKKNHELLIRAFAKTQSDAVLSIVGEGNLAEQLQTLAKDLKVEERVIFSGYRDDARRYMKAFDAFVFPSGAEEAFGMVLLEAMAASIPVLSTDAPGPKSVVGDTAVLFNNGDVEDLSKKLIEIQSKDKDAIDRQINAALTRLGAEFSIQRMVERIRTTPPIEAHVPLQMSDDYE